MPNQNLVTEFWEFLKVRKRFWLLPIVIVLLLLSALIVFTESSVIAPFIYTLFQIDFILENKRFIFMRNKPAFFIGLLFISIAILFNPWIGKIGDEREKLTFLLHVGNCISKQGDVTYVYGNYTKFFVLYHHISPGLSGSRFTVQGSRLSNANLTTCKGLQRIQRCLSLPPLGDCAVGQNLVRL